MDYLAESPPQKKRAPEGSQNASRYAADLSTSGFTPCSVLRGEKTECLTVLLMCGSGLSPLETMDQADGCAVPLGSEHLIIILRPGRAHVKGRALAELVFPANRHVAAVDIVIAQCAI